MIWQEAVLQSPLRILDRSIRGGLGKGHLGVIVAPAGVGKSACLVQLGLDALLRGRSVLHVAVGQSVDHVSTRYDALFDELAERVGLADRGGVREAMGHRRLIWSSVEGALSAHAVEDALSAFQAHLALGPPSLLVDDLAWETPGALATAAAVKASAARVGAELWMTARDAGALDPAAARLPPGAAALADLVLLLEPHARHARLSLVKDLEGGPAAELPLVLEGGTLRVRRDDDGTADERWPEDYTLVATGSAGAEAEFGTCAERWGVGEVNYTFADRAGLARTRGLVTLGEEELKLGEVSPAYLRAHLHRAFAESPELRRVLQAIWHQVSTAAEVFAVGTINPDQTVHGGTGWAVELARHWGKPVHLFEQDRGRWVRWEGSGWVPEAPPIIAHERFAGAGTRSLSDVGRAAIRELFERTFGPAER